MVSKMTILGIIHLLCACVVVGYLAYDVLVFSFFKKNRNESEFKSLKREILKPSVILLGSAFLGLMLSGAGLASFYIDTSNGILQGIFMVFKEGLLEIKDFLIDSKNLNFYGILTLKLLTISLLFIFTPISFFYILVLKKADPMRRFYHHLALIICLIAVILARLLAH